MLLLSVWLGVLPLGAWMGVANMLLCVGAARNWLSALLAGRGIIIRQLLTQGVLLAGAGDCPWLMLSHWMMVPGWCCC